MIYLVDSKTWKKRDKKIVIHRDYVIFDCTDDTADLAKYNNRMELDGFAPSKKCINGRLNDDIDTGIDQDKLIKLEKKHFKEKSFIVSILTVMNHFLDNGGDENCFIIISKKCYKAYAKTLIKKIKKLYDVDFDFVFTVDDIFITEDYDIKTNKINKKQLKKSLAMKKLNRLSKKHEKLEERFSKK